VCFAWVSRRLISLHERKPPRPEQKTAGEVTRSGLGSSSTKRGHYPPKTFLSLFFCFHELVILEGLVSHYTARGKHDVRRRRPRVIVSPPDTTCSKRRGKRTVSLSTPDLRSVSVIDS